MSLLKNSLYKLLIEDREDDNEDDHPSTSTTEAMKESINLLWRIVETLFEKLLRMWPYWLAHAMTFFFYFWTLNLWQASEIAEFWSKELSHKHRSTVVKWYEQRSRFSHKFLVEGRMAMRNIILLNLWAICLMQNMKKTFRFAPKYVMITHLHTYRCLFLTGCRKMRR